MISTDQLLADLTEPQRQAVTHIDGPLLIIAGAGSGKTRVLTRRVAYLLAQGIVPSSVLAITFTNKAAGEMKRRVGDLMARGLRDWGRLDQPFPLICTFHSLCLRILKHYAPRINLPANFTIYDTSDQSKLIKEAIKSLDLSTTNFAPGTVHGTISNAKNQLLSAEAFAQNAGDFYQRNVARIFTKYQALLKANNALDFDDLLLRTAHVMRDFPDVLAELQERFQYILIDEYQDTNHAQYVLTHALALKHRNLCVVGDPDQCLPPGTLVSTPDGRRRIESLKRGQTVSSATGWGGAKPMPIDRVGRAHFKGRLVRIQTDCGHELVATPNHLCFAKLRADASLYYTYLMWKRGVGYRIGVTRGVRSSKDGVILSGLQVRANQEVADAVWLLHSAKSSSEVRFYEQYYSVRYGIPTMIFFSRGRGMALPQDWIDRLFREIDTDGAAETLMADLHLDARYPHHRPGAVTRLSRPGWSRRRVMFTVFGDGRPLIQTPWHEHRVQMVTSDVGLRKAAGTRFRVREGNRGSWRIETSRKHYEDGLALARDISALAEDVELVPRARLTDGKAFLFMPASHIHPGMLVPVLAGGKIIESIVTEVSWEDYDGPVYDISVPDTRNYVAGGFIVHNSIYAWRGADIQNILDFEKDYPDAKVVRLEQNYRSTKTVLAIASKLIANNLQRKDKSLWTENAQGEKAKLILCQDEHDEAAVVTGHLKALHEKHGYTWNQMAIFYRMNALSRVMEDALRKAGVPYQIARGVEFYNRKEIKDVLAYLKVIANPNDEVSLTRIVNVPTRGIGDSSVKQLQTYGVANGLTLWEAMQQAGRVEGISTRAVKSMGAFVQLIEAFRAGEGFRVQGSGFSENDGGEGAPVRTEGASHNVLFHGGLDSSTEARTLNPEPSVSVQSLMENLIRRSGLEAMLKKEDPDGENELANVNELISSAAEYDAENPQGSLGDYLARVSLVSDADQLKDAGGSVTLMTLHAAKGLEFPVVAMIGLEEGCLPHSRAQGDLKQLEEERRLCFVGITRAEERLILTRAAYRTIRGLRERTATSQFLGQMPKEFLEITDRTGGASQSYGSRLGRSRDDDGEEPPHAEESDADKFHVGQKVRHPAFGIGKILDIGGARDQPRLKIDFPRVGQKTLVLPFARIEPV